MAKQIVHEHRASRITVVGGVVGAVVGAAAGVYLYALLRNKENREKVFKALEHAKDRAVEAFKVVREKQHDLDTMTKEAIDEKLEQANEKFVN